MSKVWIWVVAVVAVVVGFLLVEGAWGLEAGEVGVLCNPRVEGSRELAEYYCRRRGVGEGEIISVALPEREVMSRAEYDRLLRPVVREWLAAEGRAERIKCLVVVRGVPLKVGAYVPEGERAAWRDLIEERLLGALTGARSVAAEARGLSSGQRGAGAAVGPVELTGNILNRSKQAQAILREAAGQMQEAAAPVGAADRAVLVTRLEGLRREWKGLAGVLERQRQLYSVVTGADRERLAGEIVAGRAELERLVGRVREVQQEGFTSVAKEREKYELVKEAGGLEALAGVLLQDRMRVGDELSGASVDSELSCVRMGDYGLTAYLRNPLYVGPLAGGEERREDRGQDARGTKEEDRGQDARGTGEGEVLMVARLDGPTVEIARGLVDKAMAAEEVVLRGRACFDARGRRDQLEQHGSYGWFDEAIRRAARQVEEGTGLEVVLDDAEGLFGAGACPDTVLYCGWYSLRRYVDAFDFKVGAVGFHVASFEAETLRAGGSEVWVKRLLEEGVTATLGPVDEPFLHTFPQPEVFFGGLVSGELTLVEAYYRAKPFNSWMMVLVGDPLYRPRFAKTRGFMAQ